MKQLVFISMLGLLATAACAAPLAYEPFDYAAGQLLGFSTTAGQTNAAGQYWYNSTGAFSDAAIVSGSFTYPGFAASSGNSFTNGSSGPGSQQSNRFKLRNSHV